MAQVKAWVVLAVALANLASGAYLGWLINGWRLSGEINQLKASHATHIANQQTASADLISRTLLRERELQIKHKETEQNAAIEKEKLERDLADSNAVALRMRDQLGDLSGRISADTGTAAECAPARAAAGVLAELLGEADGLAGVFAQYADRAGIAGRACERAYDSLLPP